MTLYFVLDACAADRQVALYDSFGRYHLARVLAALPAIGTELRGSPPFPGFSLRDTSRTGEVFEVILEVVDCGRDSALRRLPPGGALPSPRHRGGTILALLAGHPGMAFSRGGHESGEHVERPGAEPP